MTMPLSRRRLLQAAAGVGLSAWAPPVLGQPVFGDYPFQLGVAAGDPAPDGFVIWTRLAPDPLAPGHGMPAEAVPVGWEVAADQAFASVVRKGEALARPELAHAVHVEIEGLEPGRPYWYRFTAGRERSVVGRARTAPPAGAAVQRVRFGVVGCQHFEQGYYTAHRHLAGEDLDFVYCYGDYIYEGRSQRVWNSPAGPIENPRQHIGGVLYTLDDYRRRYAQYKMDADLQASHAAAAWFAVWDDHEIANNWVADIAADGTPPEAFNLRRQAAVQAYYEHMPLRRRSLPSGPSMLLYRRADYGGLLRLNLLDTRQYRSDQPCGDRWMVRCDTLDRPDAEVLGREQERWLFEGLAASRARWNVLAQQVMMMDVDRNPHEGYAANLDSWGGYRAPRARLLNFLRDSKIANPIVLTGDEHQNFAGELHLDGRDPKGPPIALEFVGTSITSGGDGMDQRADMPAIVAANPQIRFNNGQRGYLVCDVTPERWVTEFKVLDRVRERAGALSTRARLAVPAGEARIVAA